MSTELTTLAIDIRREHDAAERSFRTAVEHAVRCGALLLEAKAQVPHGGWLPWLAENFPGSPRSAQGYMRLARHAEDAQALAHLGVEGALRQLAAPKATTPEERAAGADRVLHEAHVLTAERLATLCDRLEADPGPEELSEIRDEAALIAASWGEINATIGDVLATLRQERDR